MHTSTHTSKRSALRTICSSAHRTHSCREPLARTKPIDSEDGFTLIEMIVTMVLLGIFLTVFSNGLMSALTTARTTSNAASAQTEANIAFLQLDRELRGAAALTTPGTLGTATFVEFLTTNTTTPTCTQLRLDTSTATLSQRTWALPTSTVGAWSVLANHVTATQPFAVLSPSTSNAKTQLQVTLQASAGAGVSGRSRDLSATFTADNAIGTTYATACSLTRSTP